VSVSSKCGGFPFVFFHVSEPARGIVGSSFRKDRGILHAILFWPARFRFFRVQFWSSEATKYLRDSQLLRHNVISCCLYRSYVFFPNR